MANWGVATTTYVAPHPIRTDREDDSLQLIWLGHDQDLATIKTCLTTPVALLYLQNAISFTPAASLQAAPYCTIRASWCCKHVCVCGYTERGGQAARTTQVEQGKPANTHTSAQHSNLCVCVCVMRCFPWIRKGFISRFSVRFVFRVSQRDVDEWQVCETIKRRSGKKKTKERGSGVTPYPQGHRPQRPEGRTSDERQVIYVHGQIVLRCERSGARSRGARASPK